MAIFTRTNGDANGVVNVDVSRGDVAGHGIGTIISTGIGKHISIFKIDAGVDISGQTGVGGAVEAILRTVAVQSTVIAYQVEDDSSGELRVVVEATGFDAAGLQTAVRALGTVNGANLGSATAASVGLKS